MTFVACQKVLLNHQSLAAEHFNDPLTPDIKLFDHRVPMKTTIRITTARKSIIIISYYRGSIDRRINITCKNLKRHIGRFRYPLLAIGWPRQ